MSHCKKITEVLAVSQEREHLYIAGFDASEEKFDFILPKLKSLLLKLHRCMEACDIETFLDNHNRQSRINLKWVGSMKNIEELFTLELTKTHLMKNILVILMLD